jgi:hypothetical protein
MSGIGDWGLLLVSAFRLGWRRFIVYNCRGGRFVACGLGPDTAGVRVHIHGDAGDCLGSGLDGAEVHVHGARRDPRDVYRKVEVQTH